MEEDRECEHRAAPSCCLGSTPTEWDAGPVNLCSNNCYRAQKFWPSDRTKPGNRIYHGDDQRELAGTRRRTRTCVCAHAQLVRGDQVANLRSNLPNQPPKFNQLEEDLISRGILPITEAEKLFSFFSQTMNQFLWGGIALRHPDLASVRRSSSLLSTAILAVAALHIPGQNQVFEICYAEFITIISSSILNRFHTLDEIRGLCVCAFWLSDLSWKLSGHAIRIATGLNLHQGLQKMLRGKPDQFERAQLWNLLYVLDHHFSIAYSRPPVIHDSPAIRRYEEFLEYPLSGPGDVRQIAQVALFIILTHAYHVFGSDLEQALEEDDFTQLREFSVEIETWRMKWQPRSANSPFVGSYPSKGVVLHYHFAKFQLNSLALRAVLSDAPLSMDWREAANIAISSAVATMSIVLYEPDIRNAIVGVPLFTHTMVAFPAVFLLKVSWKWRSAGLNIDQSQVLNLVQNVVEMMSNVSANEKHLTYHIAHGLEKMLRRFKQKMNPGNGQLDGMAVDTSPLQDASPSQNSLTGSLNANGFGFEDTWNQLPTSLDFFPLSFVGGGFGE